MWAQIAIEIMNIWQETIRFGNNNVQESNLWRIIRRSQKRGSYKHKIEELNVEKWGYLQRENERLYKNILMHRARRRMQLMLDRWFSRWDQLQSERGRAWGLKKMDKEMRIFGNVSMGKVAGKERGLKGPLGGGVPSWSWKAQMGMLTEQEQYTGTHVFMLFTHVDSP